MKKLTTSEYILKAKTIHGNKFDYSLTVYTTTNNPIIIICPIHGKFEYSAKSHLRFGGCPSCGSLIRKTTVHKRYGVDNISQLQATKDKKIQTSIRHYGVEYTLQAPIIRKQIIQTNIIKYGVPHTLQSQQIRDKGKLTSFKKYGVEYPAQSMEIQEKIKQTMMIKYGVIHPSHSIELLEKKKSNNLEKCGYDMFIASPLGQLQRKLTWVDKYGVDSPQKSDKIKQKTKQTCVERYKGHFNQQHMVEILPLIEDYDWLFDQYITRNKTAVHIANELGISSTVVYNKLHALEIAIKTTFGYSYSCIAWLTAIMVQEGIHVQHALNGGEYNIPDTNWRADGYCPETNTIYEFHGDYWHGNPEVYDPGVINKLIGKTMGDLYQLTIKREQQIKSIGYNLVVMWENNWRGTI